MATNKDGQAKNGQPPNKERRRTEYGNTMIAVQFWQHAKCYEKKGGVVTTIRSLLRWSQALYRTVLGFGEWCPYTAKDYKQ